MGTVLAVRKHNTICLASDSMTISGSSRKHTAENVAHSEKVIAWGENYIGVASHPSWPLVLKSYFKKRKKETFKTKEEIFEAWTHLHKSLKEEYHLNSTCDDDDPFESSMFECLIVNCYGIFKVYDLRSVEQFKQFMAIGSGEEYALGALQSLYERVDSAEELAKEALKAVVEFDSSSSLPGFFYKIQL